jgi:hypothetical protein
LGQVADDFTADTNLDTAVWATQSTLLTALASASSSPGSQFVLPDLDFGTNGMEMSGLNGSLQFTGIQSLSPIAPPFTLTTTVAALGGNANEFDLFLVNADVSQSVEVTANASSNAFLVNYGEPFDGIGNLLAGNVITGRLYTIRIDVGTNGKASVLLSDASRAVLASKGGLPVGAGPFYVVLAQRNGSQPGGGSALWQSIFVTEDQPLLPPQPSLVTAGGVTYAEYQTGALSCCTTFDGIGPVIRSGSEFSLDMDLETIFCLEGCVTAGFTATIVPGALTPGEYTWITTSWGVPVYTNKFTVTTNSTPTLQPIGFTADGTFQMQLNGVANVSYVLQSSTDLMNWTSLSTNSIGAPLTDNPGASPGWRYYRLQIPETVVFSGFPPP